MSDTDYKSVLAPYMAQLMEMERAAGAVNTHLPGTLKAFDDFACSYGLKDTSVSESFITDWLKTRINESERTVYNRDIQLMA